MGVGWCACDMTNIIHHVHAHLAGLGVVQTLSDLWGGVNGHGVNLSDQCGVCDDVTG